MKIKSIKLTDKRNEYLLEWIFDYKGKNEKVWFKLNKKQVLKQNLKSGTSFLCFALLPAMVAGENIDLNKLQVSKNYFLESTKFKQCILIGFLI